MSPRDIKNTLKASVPEGGAIEFTVKVNKPVRDAEWFGQDKTSLPLQPRADDPTVLTAVLKPEKSQKSEKSEGAGKSNATSTQSALWYSAKSISRVTEEISHMADKEGLDEATKTLLSDARDNLVKIYRTLELRLKR